MKNKAMEQLEGMIGTLRVYTSRLATKESYWIFHKNDNDFDIKVSDFKSKSYLIIANDLEIENVISALNKPVPASKISVLPTGYYAVRHHMISFKYLDIRECILYTNSYR